MRVKKAQVDARLEHFAQLLAAGKKAAEAFRNAGFNASNPDVARATASRLRKQMKSRVAEILGTPELTRTAAVSAVVQDTIEAFRKDLPWCRDKLHEMINNKNTSDSVRLGAIKECLNRALGLPVQYIEENLNVRYQISDRELTEDEWFAQYVKPVEALPGPSDPEPTKQ